MSLLDIAVDARESARQTAWDDLTKILSNDPDLDQKSIAKKLPKALDTLEIGDDQFRDWLNAIERSEKLKSDLDLHRKNAVSGMDQAARAIYELQSQIERIRAEMLPQIKDAQHDADKLMDTYQAAIADEDQRQQLVVRYCWLLHPKSFPSPLTDSGRTWYRARMEEIEAGEAQEAPPGITSDTFKRAIKYVVASFKDSPA